MVDKLPPVSLYYGLESFLMEEECNQLRDQVPEEERDWNLLVMDLEETPLEQVIQEAETPSFFGGKRLIIAKNATFFTTAKPKREQNHNLDAWLYYLSRPSESSAIVFTVVNDKLDKRKKVVKQMEKVASVTKFDALKGQALLKWVMDRFRALQVKIKREVCISFIQVVGNDLRLINQECEKLSLFVGHKGIITQEIVDELIPRTLENNVFQLTEKLAEKKITEVWQIWEDLLTQKEEPIRILALMTRQFRLLYQAKVLTARGMGASEIAKMLGVHPYPVKLAISHSASFTLEQLKKYLSLTIAADQDIKSGKIEKVLAVEQIFLAIHGITA
ncbi:DNA polymerase III subunit delta [Shimazuella sp. AN120528]|uniref:DNA polymerase III subunit delta n=1 Tax=Shimazuella soli TaxID=1892854 RepID=UPI001F0E3D8B|nr:DNA polymerase III subunit delta [Shimazuella soli]MCH5583822.1 DNA polymerase III subunit delta [Shimazuella soli]